MLNIILHGCNGKMGKVLQNIIAQEPDLNLAAGIDRTLSQEPLPFKLYMSPLDCQVKADIVIDFSYHEAIPDLLEYCLRTKTAVVIATTALGPSELDSVHQAATQIPVFHSANMSLGINVLSKMIQCSMGALDDNYNVEIIEKHHNKKVDSPSGTALLLANAVNSTVKEKKDFIYGRHSKSDECKMSDLGIHAVRGGTIPGEHTVIFAGPDEVIEITHTAYSKEVFARGALKAARFLADKEPGLYSMEDLLK